MANGLIQSSTGAIRALVDDVGRIFTIDTPPYKVEKKVSSILFNKDPQISMAFDSSSNKLYIRNDSYTNISIVDYNTGALLGSIGNAWYGQSPYIKDGVLWSVMYEPEVSFQHGAYCIINSYDITTYAIIQSFTIPMSLLGGLNGIRNILGIENNILTVGQFWSNSYNSNKIGFNFNQIDLSDYSIKNTYTINSESLSVLSRAGMSAVFNNSVLFDVVGNNSLLIYIAILDINTYIKVIEIIEDNIPSNVSYQVNTANNILVVMTDKLLYTYNLSTFQLINRVDKSRYITPLGILFIDNSRSFISCDIANNNIYQYKI